MASHYFGTDGKSTSGVFVEGAPNFATGQATVPPLAAALIVPARIGRAAVTVFNNGSDTIFIGPASSVSAASGLPLPAGASTTINTTASVYAVSAADSQNVGILETYDGKA